jgi:hypothetical protein
VLPADLYAEMEAACPTRMQALSAAFKGSRYRFDRRYWPQPVIAIREHDKSTPPLDRYEPQWRDAFRPYIDLLDQLTIEAFQPHTDAYAAQLLDQGFVNARSDLLLGQALFTHRNKGWMIPPHTHTSTQVIQSMIYFPLPGAKPEHGTYLYRLKRGRSAPGKALTTTYNFANADIEVAGLMPYHENTLASFLNTPISVHASVDDLKCPSRRYTFTCVDMAGVSPPDRTVELDAFRL